MNVLLTLRLFTIAGAIMFFAANVPAQETETISDEDQTNNSQTVESDTLEVETLNSDMEQSTSVRETTSEDKDVQTAIERSAPYNGFGLNFGLTFFIPKEVNDMIGDMYDELKSGYLVYDVGIPEIFMGESFKLKGVFYLNRNLALEPYGQAFWAGKWLTITGDADRSAWINLLFYSAGLNFWLRVNPDKLVSFKTGVGGFAGYSHIEVSGDVGKVSLKGSGFGANVLAGIDVTFRKTVINIDFTVPIGVIKYKKRNGKLKIYEYGSEVDYYGYGSSDYVYPESNYSKYPKKVLLAGFEFRPGVTFRF